MKAKINVGDIVFLKEDYMCNNVVMIKKGHRCIVKNIDTEGKKLIIKPEGTHFSLVDVDIKEINFS